MANTKSPENQVDQVPESSPSNEANTIKYDPAKININYTKPIDLFFDRLVSILKSITKDYTAPIPSPIATQASGAASSAKTRPQQLYATLTGPEIAQTRERIKELETKNGVKYPDTDTFVLVSFLCQSILKVREILDQGRESQPKSVPGRSAEHNPDDMIEISLNDMKVFNTVLNLIIIDGIYPCLTPGVGVPLNLRIKSRQNLETKALGQSFPADATPPATALLRYTQLFHILNDTLIPCLAVKDDVRNLILIGSYIPDLLTVSCELAFNPAASNLGLPPAIRVQSLKNFQSVMGQTDTYSLYLNFTSLIRPKAPSWLMLTASKMLAMIPINRPSNGVLCLIEFISGVRDKPDIDIKDLDKATKILKSVPKNMDPAAYYKKIGTQVVNILALQERENTVAATIHILSQLLQQKKEMVEVGVQDQIIETISPFSIPKPVQEPVSDTIVSSASFQKALSAFTSLLRSSQPLELIHEIGKFSFISLWTLLCYLVETKRPAEQVKSVLVAFIALQPDDYTSIQTLLLRNFMKSSASNQWVWGAADDGLVEIRKRETEGGSTQVPALAGSSLVQEHDSPESGIKELESQLQLFGEISDRVSVLSSYILGPLNKHFVEQLEVKDKFVSSFFVLLVKEWLTFRGADNETRDEAGSSGLSPLDFVKPRKESSEDGLESAAEKQKTVDALVNAKLLQMMYTNHKESLLDSPVELLAVIHSTLEDYVSCIERFEQERESQKGRVEIANIQHDLRQELAKEEEEAAREKYVPAMVKNMFGIQDVTEGSQETKEKPVIQELDAKPMIQELDAKPKIEDVDIPFYQETDGDAEEIINLCFSLILAISEDLQSSQASDPELDELSSLEKIVPQLEYIVRHSPANLLQSKAAACKDAVSETLHTRFPQRYADGSAARGDAQRLSKAIKLLDDAAVPVQANGLYVLKTLVEEDSPVVRNWAMVVQIYLSKLKSEDSFVYMNAVKGLFAVCDKHGEKVVRYLTCIFAGVVPSEGHLGEEGTGNDRQTLSDAYVKSIINYMALDETLRLGEVLSKVIKRLGQGFRGPLADTVCMTMLGIVNGTLKTDRVREETGDTRDKFDDFIRMSSMSILSSAFEVNCLGLVGWVPEVLDCVIGIFQFETEETQLQGKETESQEKSIQSLESAEDQAIRKDNFEVEKEAQASGSVFMRRAGLNLLASVFANLPGRLAEPEVSAARLRSVKVHLGVAVHDRDPVIRANAERVIEIVREKEMYS